MKRLLLATCLLAACGGGGDDEGDDDAPAGVKRVFVTHGQYDGNLMALGGPDLLCQGAADGAQLGGTFKAWVSFSNEDAFDRIADVGPWYLLDGTTMAFANKIGLRAQPLVSINQDELGTVLDPQATAAGDEVVITGTSSGGTYSGANCADFTSNGEGSMTYGFIDLLSDWTAFTSDGTCSPSNGRLYCFEQ